MKSGHNLVLAGPKCTKIKFENVLFRRKASRKMNSNEDLKLLTAPVSKTNNKKSAKKVFP